MSDAMKHHLPGCPALLAWDVYGACDCGTRIDDEPLTCARCKTPIDGDSIEDEYGAFRHPVCAAIEAENAAEAAGTRAFEDSLNPDNGPSDASYREDLKNAGRGHLLS